MLYYLLSSWFIFFVFKQKTAYEMRISDWSSDVCSSDLLANNATLAGHVEVQDDAILGGLTGVHQHVRIGAHAMVGGMAGVEHDVPPFALVSGNRARIEGLNIVGLRRHAFPRAEIDALRDVYRLLFAGDCGIAESVARADRKR